MKKIKYSILKKFVKEIFESENINSVDAELIAEVLIESDVCWINSHWINRINRYLKAIQKKEIKIEMSPEVVNEFFATALVDANNCIGQKSWYFWMNKAIEIAEKFWVWVVSVKNSNHFWIAWYYSNIATQRGMIGITMTNTAPLVVPTNGKEAILWTNPIAIGAPSWWDYPWLMDFATSIVPRWKLEVASKLGKKIKKWIAVDSNWNYCTNPSQVLSSLETDRLWWLVNFGSHKWYWLGAAVDILCWVLSGSSFGKDVYSKWEPQVWHFFIAIDIKRFISLEEFKLRLSKLTEMLQSSAKEGSKVYIHWEKEYFEKQKRMKYWIPLEDEYFKLLKDLWEKYNVRLGN